MTMTQTTGGRRFWPRSLLALAAFAIALGASLAARAACQPVAGHPPLLNLASLAMAAVSPGEVRLTFVGHASFEIETPAGVRAVTDYNGYVRPSRLPHVVTMNNAHSTHYTPVVEPEIQYALRGWSDEELVFHNVALKDLRVRSIPTNIRPVGTKLAHGNSIFVFEAEGLCIAHISHVHHRLSDDQIRELGLVDVALVAVDGTVTMSHRELFDALDKLRPRLIVPMHMISVSAVRHFVEIAQVNYPVSYHDSETIVLSTRTLPARPEVRFLKGH